MDFTSIYLDFDGTVTKFDTVNTFIRTFASKGWEELEDDWVNDRISSRTCMELQLDLIKDMTRKTFDDYINSIEIEEGLKEFCALANKHNKKVTILSDGFDIFIEKTLKKYNLEHVKFYANKLHVTEKNGFLKFKLICPNLEKNCALSLGACKCAKIQKGEKFIYAGDGLSDRCIASKSILLFAKHSLKNYCLKNDIDFIEFDNFYQISDILFKKGKENAKITTEERGSMRT